MPQTFTDGGIATAPPPPSVAPPPPPPAPSVAGFGGQLTGVVVGGGVTTIPDVIVGAPPPGQGVVGVVEAPPPPPALTPPPTPNLSGFGGQLTGVQVGGLVTTLPDVISGEPPPGQGLDTIPAGAVDDTLPDWTFDDPFATRSLESTNPVLRGGDWVAALVDQCVYYHLEARAVGADAMGEALGGTIGDGGLAYGPFQDHLTEFPGRPFYGRGKNNEVVNAWAWTLNGLQYSLRQMVTSAHSARNLKGPAAVEAIVRGYERPADIAGAISLRVGYYKILLTQGDQWVKTIAAKALGPTKGGKQLIGAVTTPGSGPAAVPKPTKQWATTLHFFASDVPAAGGNARKGGARARAAVRSTLWRGPTG